MTLNELYARITALKSYLYATDYKIIRAYEQNTPVDEELLIQRQAARDEINTIEQQISDFVEPEIID